jgi:hypothetical protein
MSLGRIAALALLLVALGLGWYFVRSSDPRATPAAPTAAEAPAVPVAASKLESTVDARRSQVEPSPAPETSEPAASATRSKRGSVRGRVVDDLGAPVPRFEIRSVRGGPGVRASDRLSADSGGSGKSFESQDGSFVLEKLSKGEWMLTAARKGNVTSSPMHVTLPTSEDAQLVIVLPRAGAVDGRVLGPDDTPVADAAIHARIPGGDEPMLDRDGREPEPLARSDSTGCFHLEDITPGTFQLLASPAEGCDSSWTEVKVAPGGRAEATLRLNAGGRIVGIIDPSCGPTVGREIGLYSFSGSTGWREAKSDEGGRFVIEHVVPQGYIVDLRSERQPNGDSGPSEKNIRRKITVKPGETTEVRFAVGQEAVHIRGLVRRGGLPMQGLSVAVLPGQNTNSKEQRTQTGADGSFDTRVEELGEYRFTVSTEQQSYAYFLRTVTEPEGAALVFDLPTGLVSGVVLSPKGDPLKRVPVTLLLAPEDPAQPSKDFFARYGRTKTDEKGQFQFEFLTPGSYSLRAPDGFYRDSPAPRVPFGGVVLGDLTVGEGPCTPIEIRLVAEGRISGQVLDSQGAPVPEAGIQVFDANDLKRCAFYELRTDVRGWFEIGSIAPGTYTVGAAKQERRGRSKPVEVLAGKTAEVKFELP